MAFKSLGVATVCLGLLSGPAPAIAAQQDQEVRIEPVQGNVYLLSGSGVNTTVSVGDDGLVVVDPGTAETAPRRIAAINRLRVFMDASGAPRPGPAGISTLRYMINTSALPEHVGGNAAFATAGGSPQVYAHENVLSRLTEAGATDRAIPTLTFFGDRIALSRMVNGEPVEIVHFPNAITDGDSVVRFYRSGVVSTGALFDYTQFPRIDIKRGGSVNGLIVALNRLLTMVIPGANAEGGTYVIGANGRICDIAELSNYRNMVIIVRDRVADLIKKGMSLTQIQAAKPTLDYDTRWGRNPNWTPAMFVDAVYTSLTKPMGSADAQR